MKNESPKGAPVSINSKACFGNIKDVITSPQDSDLAQSNATRYSNTNKIVKKQSGQSLVTSLAISALITMTATYVASTVMTDRFATKVDTKRKDSTNAINTAAQTANTILRDYVNRNFANFAKYNIANSKTSQFGNSAGDAESLFEGLVNMTLSNRTFTMSSSVTSSSGTAAQVLPVKYQICFFEDKDGDASLTAGIDGKGFQFISDTQSSSNPLNRDGLYNYTFTLYGYTELPNGTKLHLKKTLYSGTLLVNSGPDSFAKYALFTNSFLTPTGGQINFGSTASFSGPVHTNDTGGFRFYGDPAKSYNAGVFKGKVTEVGHSVYWTGAGSSSTVSGSSNPQSSKDKPDFQAGFEAGVTSIPFPTNQFSQERGALGGDPASQTAVTQLERNNALGLPPATVTTPNGIYVPNNGTATTGGIYLQGNIDEMIPAVDVDGNQTYRIKQGTTNKLITVDKTNNQTIIQPLNSSNVATGSPTTYIGTPKGNIQVNGSISFLGGPARTTSSDPATAGPAIASTTQLTITATGDVKIKRDIKYQDDPTTNASATNILGIYSTGGDILLGDGTNSSLKDLTVHGALMAIDTNNSVTVPNYTSIGSSGSLGQIHLLGGIIENAYGAFGTLSGGSPSTGYGRDFIYDSRMVKTPPPLFPTTGKPSLTGVSNNKISLEDKG